MVSPSSTWVARATGSPPERRTVAKPSRRHSSWTPAKRSGWRGTRISNASGRVSSRRRWAARTISSSPAWVLAAIHSGRAVASHSSRRAAAASGSCGSMRRSNLIEAGHADALRTRAETTEALGLGLGLHGDPGQLGEHRPGQPGEARVATRRALGQARIGQRHRDPAHGAGMDMVGPQLGFHDHRQARPHPVEEARRRPGQVVGQVAVPDLLAEQCADALRSRSGSCR